MKLVSKILKRIQVIFNRVFRLLLLLYPRLSNASLLKIIKRLRYFFLIILVAVTQVAIFGTAPNQKVVAQTSGVCPVGTVPTLVNWQPAVGVDEISAQNLNAGGVGVRLSFAESIPGQVIESNLVEFRNEIYGTRIDNEVYGGLPGPNLKFHIGIGKNPAPVGSSATLTINFDRPVTLASPLTILDVDRDGARDLGFTFQDRVTVNAFNGASPVDVTLQSLGTTTRVTGNTVVGINENSFPNRPDGNVSVRPAGQVTSIQLIYEPGTEFGPPRQDETIGLARINICAPSINGSIGDTVFNDRNGNGIQDQGERGIANATLILRGADGQEISRTTTNSSGIYGFTGLPLASYTVEALRPNDDFRPTTNTTLAVELTQANPIRLDIDFGFRSTAVGAADTPNIRLIKRITNATRNGQSITGTNFNTFVPDPNNDNDDTLPTPERFQGVPNLETPVQSGDEIEYTVYFLTEGNENITNVRFCDLVPNGTTFTNNSIGISGAGTDADGGRYLTPLAPLETFTNICPGSNNNGAVIANLGSIPGGRFGFVRFRVTIN
ncbi:MAG: carboxypeptidase regulatory-like domain-containing protein [Calothrix sp. C42_A2020_038]|nr:carboxypeptidase regulatory-like domain-containing protein [Calothrix sp. C42_A2020_038]